MSLDINGARVHGEIRVRGVRAVWHEGFLYIVHSPSNVTRIAAPDEPVRRSGAYQVAGVSIQAPTCGCQRKKELAALSIEQIIAVAEGAMADA